MTRQHGNWIFGPGRWAQRAGRSWTHWDLWFCVVAALDFDGDLGALAEVIYARVRLDPDWEARVSHLNDLSDRPAAAGLTASALAAPGVSDSRTRVKARRKVLQQGLAERDRTDAMRNTPTRRLRTRALCGWWSRFPVDPTPYRERMAEHTLPRLVQGWGGVRMTRELRRLVEAERRAAAGDVPRELALWRAAVTVGEETFDAGLRDSEGEFAGWCGTAFATYAALPWSDSGLGAEVYLRDLCELWVCERYAFAFRRERDVFAGVRAEHMDRAEAIFLELHEEHRRARLDFAAQQALEGLAWASVAAADFARMPAISGRLGSDSQVATLAMVEAAVSGDRFDIAHSVFDGADVPGWHREFLQQRRANLLPPRTRRTGLRVVR